MHGTRIGPLARATTDSRSSSRLGSAQCTSSISATSGAPSASDSEVPLPRDRAEDQTAARLIAFGTRERIGGELDASVEVTAGRSHDAQPPPRRGTAGSRRSRAFATKSPRPGRLSEDPGVGPQDAPARGQ